MRYPRELVHPSLFKAIDRVNQIMWSGQTGSTPAEQRALVSHQAVWWKEKGPSLMVGFFAFGASIIGIAALKPILGKPATGIVFLLIMFGWLAMMAYGFSRKKRTLSTQALATLMPALELTSIQRHYAESLLALAEIEMPDEQRQEVLAQLNRLMDEEARLIRLRDCGAGTPVTIQAVAHERDELRAKLDAATDPLTRDALAQSLEICQGRVKAAEELSLVGQRVDAQFELIGQAIAGVRDSLLRLHASPVQSISLDLDNVRASVEQAHRHAAALEAAVAELQTIG